MVNKKDLRGGIVKMREVAQLLTGWADDLEASSAAGEKKDPAVMLPEVRAVLAEKCSKGFRAQVKALIDSFGASALRDVAPEHYGELLGMARQLGEAPATASGGNPERGEGAGPEGEQDAG